MNKLIMKYHVAKKHPTKHKAKPFYDESKSNYK